MARVFQCGFESGDLLADGISTYFGTPTYETTIVHGSGRSIKFTGRQSFSNSNTITVNFVRAYVKFGAWPNVSTPILCGHSSLGGLGIGTTGLLHTYTGNNTSGSTAVGTTKQLALNVWYLIEINGAVVTSSGNDTLITKCNGVQLYSSTATNLTDTTSSGVFAGLMASTVTSGTMYMDDMAANDSTGSSPHNSWLGDGDIVNLTPSSDSARGSNWVAGAGGTTLWSAVDNAPPAGVVLASATNTSQIKNAAKDVVGTYVAAFPAYNASIASGGAGASGPLDVVMAVAPVATYATSSTTAMQQGLALSNPSITEALSSFTSTVAAASHPTNWVLQRLAIQQSPTVTLSSGPTMTVRKNVSSTVSLMLDYMAAPVDVYRPQYAVPDGVLGNVSWTASAGAIEAAIDDTPGALSNTDYAQTSATDTLKLSLSTLADAAAIGDQIRMQVWAKKSGTGTENLQAELRQSGVSIYGPVGLSPGTGAFQQSTVALSDSAAAAITDFDNLELWLIATASGGGNIQVSSAYVQTGPALDAVPPPSVTASDTVATISDAATRGGGTRPRTATDSVTISDALTRLAAKSRAAADSVATISDVAVQQKGYTRTGSDTVSTISDAATRAAYARTRTASDSVTVSDANANDTAHPRSVSDTVATISDAATKSAISRPRTASDSTSVSDATTRAAYVRTRTSSDSVATISDASTHGAVGSSRTAADGIGAKNMIVNPSFEADTTGAAPAIWTQFTDITETMTVQASDASYGSKSLRITAGSTMPGSNYVGAAVTTAVNNPSVLTVGLSLTDYNLPVSVYIGVVHYYYNSSLGLLGNSAVQYWTPLGWTDGFWPQFTPGKHVYFTETSIPVGTVFCNTFVFARNFNGGSVGSIVDFSFDAVALYEDGSFGNYSDGYRVSSDAATVAASVHLTRTASDSSSVSDAATRAAMARTAVSSDSTSVSDTVSRVRSGPRATSEPSLTVSDAVSRLLSLPRTISEPSLTVSDAVSRARAGARSVSDSVTLSDAVTRLAAFARTASEAGLTVSDSINDPAGHPRSTSDTVSVSDSPARAVANPRAVADSWSISDAATRAGAGTLTRTSSDSVTVSDAATRALQAFSRTGSDSVTVSDAAAKLLSVFKATSDSVTVTDAVARLASFARSASESALTVSDSVNDPAGHPRSVADTVSVSDSLARVVTNPRAVADSWSVSDAATRAGAGSLTRTSSDAFSVSEAATRAAQTFGRTAADSDSVSDAVARIAAAARAAVDSSSVSDSVTRVASGVKAGADSWTATDSVSRTRTSTRSTADSVAVSDLITKTLSVTKTGSDSVTVSDLSTGTTVHGFTRTGADSVTVSDSPTRLAFHPRNLSDSTSVSDTVTRAAGKSRTASDAVSFSDAVTRGAAVHPRNLSEVVTVSDVGVPHIGASRTASDAIGLITDATAILIGAGAPFIQIPSDVIVEPITLRVDMPNFHSIVDTLEDVAFRAALAPYSADAALPDFTTKGDIPAHTTKTAVNSH